MRAGSFLSKRSRQVPLAVACAGLSAVLFPLALGRSQYALDVAQVGLAFALFTVSWDVACGLTGEVSFGHSLFVGAAAYGTALTQTRLGLPPIAAVLVGLAVGALAGLLVGALTLRQTGAVFAIVTMAAQLTFHRALFLWSGFFGGEEGITIPGRLVSDASLQFRLMALISVGGLSAALVLRQSRFGRQLRASGGDTRVGVASGVPVFWVRIAGCAFSGLLAGVGGSLLTMQNMLANQEMAGDSLAGLIFLLAAIGGTGTLVGPWLAAMFYVCGLRQLAAPLGKAEPMVVFGLLLLLVWLLPQGAASALRRWSRRLAGHVP